MLQYKNKNTPVAVVRNTGRSGENYDITTLEKMLDFEYVYNSDNRKFKNFCKKWKDDNTERI